MSGIKKNETTFSVGFFLSLGEKFIFNTEPKLFMNFMIAEITYFEIII